MSWVVILWSMDTAFCFTLAGIYLLVWFKQRQEWVHLLFACSAVAAGLIAGLELALMHAETTAQYGALLRLEHLPQWILVVSVAWFVRLYLRAGRRWLVWTICGLRTLALVLNFLFFKPNLNYREITSLRHLPWWGGETVSVAVGVPNPWILVGMLSVLLLLIFLVDATITVWRRGDRRRALMVGGSAISFITLSLGISALVLSGVIRSPFFISFPFLGMIAAMGYELSDNVLRAAHLARQFQASEAALRESEVRFRTVADSAPVLIWMSGVDKLCTFFNKPWLEFTGRTMEQEMGNGWAEGVHPDDLQRCLKTYVEAFDARQPFVMQYRLRRHDGEYRWIKDDGVPRYDAQKNFTGYIGSCADVTESINKEQALRESEERMSLAVDAANLGLWEWNVRKDELWGTKARRALLGLPTSGKIKLEEALSTVHIDDRDRVRHTMTDAARTSKNYYFEYRTVLPDGSIRWTEHRGRCVRGPDGKDIILRGISMDVTERKRAEEEFRMAVEASPSGILLVNQTGQIVLVNAHIEELFGYGREELIGQSVEILVPERFAGAHPEHRANFFAAPTARAMGAGRELFARRKDGSEFPVEIGLNPIQTAEGALVLAVVVDISERKRAEEKFRMAVEASPSGILLVNEPGKIVLVNSQIEELFGYGRDELIGHSVEILVPERFARHHPEHRAKFFAAPAARAMGAGRELFARRKDGSEFPVEIGLNPIQTPEGMLILAAVVDISARKESEAEALRHREELSHFSRVTAMGELAASIAHELNQPLSGITINASTGQRLIDRGDGDLGELRNVLSDIVADARRAGEVIRGIQNMVKKGSSARQRLNLNDVVTNTVRMVIPNAMLHSCELEILLEPNLPDVEADPVQIQQVLLNLVINALDAIQDAPVGRRKVLIATERSLTGAIRTSVRDYGNGIPEEVRARVFEQFFTTKAKGLGMGLAIVQTIIKSHGGSIVAENADDGGARFYFTLPTTDGHTS